MTRVLAMLCAAAVLAIPARAAAQSPDGFGTLYYGISAGVGHRAEGGVLPQGVLKLNTTQPPARAIGVLDLEGGVGLARRVSLMGIFDKSAPLQDGNGWGSLAADAVVRAWLAEHAWVEGGVSVTELAFRPEVCVALFPSPCSAVTLWRTGFEAGGGYEIFHGPTVTLHVFARYSQATFEGLRQRTLTVQVGLLGRH